MRLWSYHCAAIWRYRTSKRVALAEAIGEGDTVAA